MQQMRLAEANRRMDVQRIEPRRLAQRRLGDLRGTRVRHAVRRSDNEAVERVARIERRALEAADAGATGRRNGGNERRSPLTGISRPIARAIGGIGSVGRFHLRTRMRVVAGRAQRHFDLLGAFELGTAAAEQRFGVVRLDPSPQELDRNRELDRAGFEAFEFQRVEPAHEDVVAELGAQHGAHLLATRLVSGREGSRSRSGRGGRRTLVYAAVSCARKAAACNGTFRLLNRLHV